MASNCPPIKIQQFDDNGDPAVGYKLYTYETGTTTPKVTHTNSAGSADNTNPIILDARGEATVFLATGAYRFALKTDADVTVWTQDGIYAPSAGTGVTISNSGVIDIDEASAAEAYGMTDAANIMTTRRLRNIYYAGTVDGVGTAAWTARTDNASAWTLSRSSAGVYLVTHNLGLSDTDSLIIVISAQPPAVGESHCATAGPSNANRFLVNVRDENGDPIDTVFNFFAIRVAA